LVFSPPPPEKAHYQVAHRTFLDMVFDVTFVLLPKWSFLMRNVAELSLTDLMNFKMVQQYISSCCHAFRYNKGDCRLNN